MASPRGKALMFQGTGSDVGKSLIVAGLARLFANRGLKVLPFKPQNMSNNAAVTEDGGEIGRAQALQARAARAELSVHMNPVLLKPQSQIGAQVVVRGRVRCNARAGEYQKIKQDLMPTVLESFAHLKAQADLVLVEGAGSASEINLRANDIANMGFARAADVPVVLIGDIERGGVIASLVGTNTVIDEEDQAMIAGFLVNRMRGDASLFDDGIRFVHDMTGWHALGLIPFFEQASRLPAEDALALKDRARWESVAGTGQEPAAASRRVRIAVPVLPRIANFDDLDPLRLEPDVELLLLEDGVPLPADIDLVLIPGSKATIADLKVLYEWGWDLDIKAHVRRGGEVLGICGGYQMLGRKVADPDGIEGSAGEVEGLGLLDVETVLTGDKRLSCVKGESVANGVTFSGFEMHTGRTTGEALQQPFLRLEDGRSDGACSRDGKVCGTYVHGLFGDDRLRKLWIDRLRGTKSSAGGVKDYDALIDETLDQLAVHLERHVDIDALLKLAR